jgi:hypothetical protein
MTTETPEMPVNPGPIMGVMADYWQVRLLLAAVEHGVFSELSGRPATSAELAGRLGLVPQGTHDLLVGLSHLGPLELEDGKFDGNPYDTLYQDAEATDGFLDSMDLLTASLVVTMSRYDWSRHGSFIDIGGAWGSFAHRVVSQNPHLTGAVFDLPPPKAAFARQMEQLGELPSPITFYGRSPVERRDAAIALVEEVVTDSAERQQATAAAVIKYWEFAQWPDGLVARSLFTSTDGKSLLSCSDRAAARADGPGRGRSRFPQQLLRDRHADMRTDSAHPTTRLRG